MIKAERIKKWGLLISLVMLFLVSPLKVKAAQSVALVGEDSVSPGATVKYNIVLNAADETTLVTGFTTTITYDSSVLTLNKVDLGTNWSGSTESVPTGKTISFNSEAGVAGETIVATLVFKVNSNASSNSAYINLKGSSYAYKDETGSDTMVTLDPVNKDLNVKSSDNTLKSLKVNGVVVEGFSANVFEYDLNVESTIDVATILATTNSTKATFKMGGGNRSVNLNYGSNVVQVIVVSESGVSQTYTLNITREDTRSTDTTLASITVDGEAIPNFKSTIYKYTVKKYKTEGVSIVGVPSDDKATVVVTPPKNVVVGDNTYIVTVTSEKGDKAIYTVIINNMDNSINKKLKNLSIKGYDIDFDKNNNRYEISYDKQKFKDLHIYFTTVASSDEVTATLSPDINNDEEALANLKPGDEITISVTGIDDETVEYTIVILEEKISFFLVLELFLLLVMVITAAIIYIKRKTDPKTRRKNMTKSKKNTNTKEKSDSKTSSDSKTKKKRFSIYEEEYEEVEVEVDDDTKELSTEDLKLK